MDDSVALKGAQNWPIWTGGCTMNISMSLLAHYLRDYDPVCSIEDDGLDIIGVRYLSDARVERFSEYVYVGAAESYFSDSSYQGDYLLVNKKSWIRCRNCSQEDLLNDILAAFEFYSLWERRLYQLSGTHSSLNALLSIVAEILPDPVLIFDLNGHLMNGSHLEVIQNDPSWSQIIQEKKMDAAYLCTPVRDSAGELIPDLMDKPQLLFREDNSDISAICMYLMQNTERIAFCVVAQTTTEQSERNTQLIGFLAEHFLLAQEFTHFSSSTRSDVAIIQGILDGKPVNPEIATKFLTHTKLKIPLQLIFARNHIHQNYTSRSLIIQETRMGAFPCFSMEYEHNLLFLIRSEDSQFFVQDLVRKIGAESYAIGISMPMYDLEKLPFAYQQACFALSHGTGAGIYSCRDYAMDYLISTLRAQELTAQLLHPAVDILQRYDQSNQTQLLQTLLVYLQQEQNMSETARLLHVHRNTMKYRMEKILQLTQIDLSDWQEQTYLTLSLLLKEPSPRPNPTSSAVSTALMSRV